GALCEASGAPTFCGGNLGNMPLIDAVDHPANAPGGLIVAEVAAFMLENCTEFRASAGVLTNITEDHLDRFGTMARYAAINGQICDTQPPGARRRASPGSGGARRGSAGTRARPVRCLPRPGPTPARAAALAPVRREIVLRGVTDAWGGREERYPTSDLVIIGNHNLENAMG